MSGTAKQSCLLLLSLTLLLSAAPAHAEAMRCGIHLIRPGDTKTKVLKECGEPQAREVVSGSDEPKVEQWTYVFDDTRFPRVLTFRGIRLVRIELITSY